MEIKMKAISNLEVLLFCWPAIPRWGPVQQCHAVQQCRLCSARQTRPAGKVSVPCKHRWRAASGSQRLPAFPHCLSLMAVFLFSSHHRQTYCLGCGPVHSSGNYWEKTMAISCILGFLTCSWPQGRFSPATNNSPAHQSFFLRFKLVEICFFLCVGVYIY